MMYNVYKITFPDGLHYVGCTTKTINKRFDEHVYAAKNKPKYKIHNAFIKHGFNANIELIESVDTRDQGFLLEEKYVTLYDSYLNGYNDTPGGFKQNAKFGGNYWMVGKTLEQIKEINDSKIKDNSGKDNSGKNNPFYGKTHKKESLDKMVAKRQQRGSYDHLKDPTTNPLHQPHVMEKTRERMTANNPMKDPVKIKEKLDKTAQRYGFKDNEELLSKIKTLYESGLIRSEIVKKLNITKDILNPRLIELGLKK